MRNSFTQAGTRQPLIPCEDQPAAGAPGQTASAWYDSRAATPTSAARRGSRNPPRRRHQLRGGARHHRRRRRRILRRIPLTIAPRPGLFVTRHLKDGSMNLTGLAIRRRQTVVIYMGLSACSSVRQAHGTRSLADWPAAIVQHGTGAQPATVTGTLTTAHPGGGRQSARTDPIIGEVVTLRDSCAGSKSSNQAQRRSCWRHGRPDRPGIRRPTFLK